MRSALPLLAAFSLAAAEPVPVPAPQPDDEEPGIEIIIDPRHAPARPAPEDHPGVAPVAAAAEPAAYLFTWDQYRTLVVVGEGLGRRRPAWVATYAAKRGAAVQAKVGMLAAPADGQPPKAWPRPVISYRALAYADAKGRIHLDARRSLVAGPLAGEWIPDSFMLTLPQQVDTIDDEPSHPGHRGAIELVVPAGSDAYRDLRQRVEVAVGGGV